MALDESTTVQELKREVEKFRDERSWKRFHKPKDLALSIAVEAGELLEIFQWREIDAADVAADKSIKGKLEDELADVMVYCLSLASVVGIDVSSSIYKKLEHNKKKYPAERYHGKAR